MSANPEKDTEKRMNNPIDAAMAYLQDCGYTENESRNLLCALQHESKDELVAMMDDWINHVGEHKKYQICILDLVAMGIVRVNGRNGDGEWLFQLAHDKARAAGFGPEDLA